jgi:hypothetical protein
MGVRLSDALASITVRAQVVTPGIHHFLNEGSDQAGAGHTAGQRSALGDVQMPCGDELADECALFRYPPSFILRRTLAGEPPASPRHPRGGAGSLANTSEWWEVKEDLLEYPVPGTGDRAVSSLGRLLVGRSELPREFGY